MPGGAPVPRGRYPEMYCGAVDKVASWRIFRKKIKIIFLADSTPM